MHIGLKLFALAALIFAGQGNLLSNDAPTGYVIDLYTPEDIGSTEVLHSVAVDLRGRVFVVTPEHRAVFWYDGTEWHTHPFDGIPRCVVQDVNGDILLGSNKGASRIKFDNTGQLVVEQVPIKFKEHDDHSLLFSNVEPGGAYLFNHMVRVNLNDEVPEAEHCEEGFGWGFVSEKASLLIPSNGPGLFEKRAGDLNPISGFEDLRLQGATIVDESVIFGWTNSGKILRQMNGEPAAEFSSALAEEIDGARVFEVVALNNGNIGITSMAGFFECNPNGEIINVVNKRDGLSRNLVFRMTDDDGVLWLCCGRSLAKVRPSENSARYRISDGSSKIHDFSFDGARFYFTTDYGIDYLEINQGLDSQTRPVGGLKESATYSVDLDTNRKTITASTSGLFQIEKGKAKPICDGRYYSLLPLDDGLTLTSNQNGTVLLIDTTGSQVQIVPGPVFPFEVRYLYKVSTKEVLVAGWNGAWAMMEFDKSTKEMTAVYTDSKARLKGPVSLFNQVAFLFDIGVCQVQVKNGNATLVEQVTENSVNELVKSSGANNLIQVGDNSYVTISKKAINLYDSSGDELTKIDSWFLKGIGKCHAFFHKATTEIYCIDHDEFVVIDLKKRPVPDLGIPRPIIKSVINESQSISGPTDETESEITLKPRGEIQFSFSVPACEIPTREFEYQYRMKGFDNSWSEWTLQRRKEYTNLPGGLLEFQVRARAGKEFVSDIESLSISVGTPWYETLAAKLGFMFLTLLSVVSVVWLRSSRLAKANQRMEKLVKERTREIEIQKEKVREKSELLIRRTRNDESERLESLSRSLGCIAHDFNNLLFVVSANCEILEMSADDSLLNVVQGIKTAGSTAAGLCSQIQSFSGTLPVNQKSICLAEEIQNASDQLNASVGKNVALEIQTSPEPQPILVDPIGLQQILLNLVVNASESNCQKITIKTGQTRLTEYDLGFARTLGRNAAPGSYQWIEVIDDGSGIEPDSLSQIFDPFYTTKKLGRGLGLSIVIRIVNDNGGLVFVESQVEEQGLPTGSTFKICFPTHRENQSCGKERQTIKEASEKFAIMIVDDDATVVTSLRGCFSRLGHEVRSAESGFEALEVIELNNLPDVFLIDVSMPDMRGDKLASELIERGIKIPIFLMSGFSSDAIDPAVLANKQIEFFRKPFKIKDLIQAIETKCPRNSTAQVN